MIALGATVKITNPEREHSGRHGVVIGIDETFTPTYKVRLMMTMGPYADVRHYTDDELEVVG